MTSVEIAAYLADRYKSRSTTRPTVPSMIVSAAPVTSPTVPTVVAPRAATTSAAAVVAASTTTALAF